MDPINWQDLLYSILSLKFCLEEKQKANKLFYQITVVFLPDYKDIIH